MCSKISQIFCLSLGLSLTKHDLASTELVLEDIKPANATTNITEQW